MNHRFDSIIFDMDGTLWDAVDSYCAVWDATSAAFGIDRKVTRNELIECMGMTIGDIFDRVAAASCPPDKREAYLKLLDRNERTMMPHLGGKLYPGVAEGMEKMSRKFPLFMVSNCGDRGLHNFLQYTGLTPFVTDTLTYGQTGFGKDYNIKEIMRRNNLVSPVYIGDTSGDCRSAHAAGVPMMHVTYGFGTAPDADFTADNFTRLTDFFLKS